MGLGWGRPPAQPPAADLLQAETLGHCLAKAAPKDAGRQERERGMPRGWPRAKESMRLWPVGGEAVVRQLGAPVAVPGGTLPAGAILLLPFYVMFRPGGAPDPKSRPGSGAVGQWPGPLGAPVRCQPDVG